MLIIFSGLPGAGKTSIARDLSWQLRAVFIRVDSIEAAMKRSALKIHPAEDAGYLAAMAITAENLALGNMVVADSVNPIELSRRSWNDVAAHANVPALNVEVTCTDEAEHRQRVENRDNDIEGLDRVTWEAVQQRQFDPWHGDRVRIDTAGRSIAECVAEIATKLTVSRRWTART